MEKLNEMLIRLQLRLTEDEGDVPGWVLVTVMTAGLVVGLWAIAGPLLQDMFAKAISSVVVP